MTTLQINQLSKQFRGSLQPAIQNISFHAGNSEILALVGPSGCGKTTTLRLIAGLEHPDSGTISINGRLVAGHGQFTPPEKRGIGMVFQDHALFPHLTVEENIAFGLRNYSRKETKAKVDEFLSLVGLSNLSARYPHALSGGERQRVALARALAPKPALVLMDEPFSSLDADRRLEVREQVRSILKKMEATALFVTHDQEEALYMGDRLAVFHGGQIEQIGRPEEIFHASATRFVAEFMGDSDFLRGQTANGGVKTELGLLRQPSSLAPDTAVEVALRADDVDFRATSNGGNAIISDRFFRGAFNVYRLRLDSGQIVHAYKDHTTIMPAGQRVDVHISAGHPLSVFRVPPQTVATTH